MSSAHQQTVRAMKTLLLTTAVLLLLACRPAAVGAAAANNNEDQVQKEFPRIVFVGKSPQVRASIAQLKRGWELCGRGS